MTSLRLVFMGTPEFAVPTLEALLDAGHEVAAVYTRPPRPAGRGRRERPSPVHAFAETRGLVVRTPTSLKSEEARAEFAAITADAAVVAAYGLILPPPVLAAPRLGCFNVHASLLPRWRGAAPIQRAIMAGDNWSGVTIMKMDAGLDTGPIVLQERVRITGDMTAGMLHDRLAGLGATLMLRALAGVADGSLVARPQPGDGATYAAKLTPEEERLDWSRPAAELDRLVRALAPRPGAWFEHAGGRVKVLAAEPAPQASGPAGTVLDDAATVACGAGGLRLTRLQRPGKAPLPAAEFLRGHPLAPGTQLG